MSWKSTDVRPDLARRIFADLAAQTGKTVMRPSLGSNDGRGFQDRIVRTASAYRALKVLKLEKVDPPTRIIPGNKILFMENPWPDFVGVFHDGRMLAIEAKSTADGRLPFDVKSGGVTSKQARLLIDWGRMGAISGILWECAGTRCCWVPWILVEDALNSGKRSFDFDVQFGLFPVLAGKGLIEWDFACVVVD